MSKYKTISNRHGRSEESMGEAVNEVLEKSVGYLKASKEYQITRTTL